MNKTGMIAGLLVLLSLSLYGQEQPVETRFLKSLALADPDARVRAWVYFTAKSGLAKLASPEELVSHRSIERRRRVLPPSAVVDETDLPVDGRNIQTLQNAGLVIRERSRWLNAVSVEATAAQLREVAALPFVANVEPLLRGSRRSVPDAPPPPVRTGSAKTSSLSYGNSLSQINSINAAPLHDAGNFAQGIVIGVFDNGFRLLSHEAFAQMNILATYDFVDRKTSVIPLNTGSGFGEHGVMTLSTIGGYKPGTLIGPAFGATYILLRTENDSSETPFEEDKWIAGIEWADSIGVQVTSTSLGYLDYDYPYTSWTWHDMDGRTTPITRAAAMAVRKGILVVNSAGNNGYGPNFPFQNTLNAPADADSVLSVGAVTPGGTRAAFSSVGPTTSTPARIKPDVMAQGTNIVAASPYSPGIYYSPTDGVQGTSFSCPLAAGAAALIMKAVHTATPMQIVNAMKATANRAQNPDNAYGWGAINAAAAVAYLGGQGVPPPVNLPAFKLTQNYPNPFNPTTVIDASWPQESEVLLAVYDLLGREVSVIARGRYPAGTYTFVVDGSRLASGAYIYRLTAGNRQESKRMMLVR